MPFSGPTSPRPAHVLSARTLSYTSSTGAHLVALTLLVDLSSAEWPGPPSSKILELVKDLEATGLFDTVSVCFANPHRM